MPLLERRAGSKVFWSSLDECGYKTSSVRMTVLPLLIMRYAIQALKAGYTSREIEKVIRKIRLTNKKASADPENEALNHAAVNALDELRSMGDTGNTGL